MSPCARIHRSGAAARRGVVMRALVLVMTSLAATMAVACGSASAAHAVTPLASAARAGDVAAIDRLLAAGANINEGSGVNGWSPAMHAIHKGEAVALAHLLDRGAALDGESGSRALAMAAGYGNIVMVRVLLAHGVAPSSTILEAAVGGAWDIDYRWSGCAAHTAVTRALLEKNPAVRVPRSANGRLALFWAGWKGCDDLLRLLS